MFVILTAKYRGGLPVGYVLLTGTSRKYEKYIFAQLLMLACSGSMITANDIILFVMPMM